MTTFGCEQLIGQVYRVFKLTRDMLPADGRGHKVHFCTRHQSVFLLAQSTASSVFL